MISFDHVPSTHLNGTRVSIVYAIVLLPTKRKYIGGTLYGRKRVKQHFSELRKGSHYNKRLQSDFNEFGEDSFRVDVLKKINLRGELNWYGATHSQEENFIRRLNPYYNVHGNPIKKRLTKLIS